jgi:acetylornithine/N-succinyldiaminopimelate aminotransferase
MDLLGTTFGGNHLACAAGLAVLEVIGIRKSDGACIEDGRIPDQLNSKIFRVTEVRGKGLMIGIDLDREAGPVRSELVNKYKIFTGSSAGKHTIRLLPPLNIEMKELSSFLDSLKKILS